MCRNCAGDCSHVGDSDRLEWRETDLWPTPEGGYALSRPETAPLSDADAESVHRPTRPSQRLSAPILRRDGGER